MKDKAEKKRWGLIFFIVLIMVGTSFSFVFYGFSGDSEKVKYNGATFVKFPDRWEAKINGRQAAFTFLPSEVENIVALDDSFRTLQGKPEIDVTYDLNSTYKESIALAQHQMELTLSAYDVYVGKGFTANNTFNKPIIRCADATFNVPVVYFRQGNTTNIHDENNCIIAEASANADFIKVKDRLLYGILGVMK